VVLCEGWDDPAKLVPAVYPASGLYPAGDGQFYGAQDTSIKTSGAGSLRLTSRVAQPNSAGQWVTYMGGTFGQNTTFYVQFRYRLTQEMLGGTGGGRKVAVFHYAFHGCADLELATQNVYYRGYPQMYSDCGAQNMERMSGSELYIQQGADPFPTGDGWNCPYSNQTASRCSFFQANTWMTFYYRIDVGTWGQANSRIQAWVGNDGQPLKQFINYPNYRINNFGPTYPGFDHISLMSYDTGATTLRNGSVWYDELIVSTQPIAAPLQ
jgi:hypothetical protein